MSKKILIRAAVGFPLGALVAVILGVVDMRFCSQELTAAVAAAREVASSTLPDFVSCRKPLSGSSYI